MPVGNQQPAIGFQATERLISRQWVRQVAAQESKYAAGLEISEIW